MSVLNVPPRLKLAASSLALLIPFAALETVLASRAPWWRLPYQLMGWISAITTVFAVTLAWGLLGGRRWVLSAGVVLGGASCWLTLAFAFWTRNPSLGFYIIFFLAYGVAAYTWISYEMGKSFFDPGMGWFQASPKPIPGLSCELVGLVSGGLRVSRLDEDGAFVFSSGALKLTAKPVNLVFSFRERQIQCVARPVRIVDHDAGAAAGFRFDGMTPDALKNLGDFVETLRGEGHV